MENKRMQFKIETLSFNGFELFVSNQTVMNGWRLSIDPQKVEWFTKDEKGNSVQVELKIGSIIECDHDIIESTRRLQNVKIISQ